MRRFLLLPLALLLAAATTVEAQRMTVNSKSDAARAEFEQARARWAHVDFDGAVEHLEAALAADPGFALAHLYRASSLPLSQRAEHMRQAQAARVSAGERELIEAVKLHNQDDHDRERAILTKLAKEFPNDPWPSYHVGTSLNGSERYDEAVAALQRATAADPNFAGAYNIMGYAEMGRGNKAAAESAFKQYIRLAPNEANPYDSMGEFYMLNGRLDEAAAQFKKALERDPNFTVSSNNLVRIGIERANKRFEQAVAKKDAKTLAALYTPTGRLLPPNEAAVNDRDAIRDYWGGVFDAGIDGIDLTTDEVYVADNTATELNHWTVSVNGEVVDSGRATVVWAKVGDDWLMHRDMWSSDRAPAGSTAGN
ncbi:hypothetical protein BH20GEM2_BH20GEM2_05580 [soil metagenome]